MIPETFGNSSFPVKNFTNKPVQYLSAFHGVTAPTYRMWAIFIIVTLIYSLLFFRNVATASENIELALVDGTVVHGTLKSFENGIYTINSNTLGTLRIEAAKVKTIRTEGLPASSPDTLQALQKRMEGDSAVMDSVKSLQEDPDFQAILTDQEILRAITAGDLRSLENNQKLKNLLNKPTVREIEQKLRQPQ
jgi:hypothetical protein